MRQKIKLQGFILLFFLWCGFSSAGFAQEYTPFSDASATGTENFGTLPSASAETFGSTASADQPALYGPGGDPIGGLPVKDGCLVLILAGLAYALYKKKSIQTTDRKEER